MVVNTRNLILKLLTTNGKEGIWVGLKKCTAATSRFKDPARQKKPKNRYFQKTATYTFSLFFTRFSRAARFKPVFAPSLAKYGSVATSFHPPLAQKRQKNR